jgi:hypothetical protein
VRLGVIIEPEAANSNYRVIIPMRALERRGHTVIWPSDLAHDLPNRVLADCDLVHCFRRPDRLQDLKRLSQNGVAVSFDNDDDLTATDRSSTANGDVITGARGRLSNARKFGSMLKIARFADLTTTPSETLAEKYRTAGAANVVTIENYLDEHVDGFGSRTKHRGMVIGWIAGKEHEGDLRQIPLANAIESLLDTYSQLRVLTIGSRLPLVSPRYEHRERVLFGELLRACGDIDVGIAPLADTQFNRARSNVKLKEYGAGGAAWLASPVGPYRAMGEREGGHLVQDSDWRNALGHLIDSGRTRRRLSRRALRWARSQTIDRHVSLWEAEFLQAVERAKQRIALARSPRPRATGSRRYAR